MEVGRSSVKYTIACAICGLVLIVYSLAEFDFQINTGICSCIFTSEYLSMVKSVYFVGQ